MASWPKWMTNIFNNEVVVKDITEKAEGATVSDPANFNIDSLNSLRSRFQRLRSPAWTPNEEDIEIPYAPLNELPKDVDTAITGATPQIKEDDEFWKEMKTATAKSLQEEQERAKKIRAMVEAYKPVFTVPPSTPPAVTQYSVTGSYTIDPSKIPQFALSGVFSQDPIPENPRAVNELRKDIDSALSDAAPQIIKPEKPIQRPMPPAPKLIDLEEVKPVCISGSITPWPPGRKTVKWPKNIWNTNDWGKDVGDWSTDDEEKDDTIVEDDDGNWAGTFQPSLKQTNNFVTNVFIGNPKKAAYLNCIENSRGELIYFHDNQDVIYYAVEKFNKEHSKASKKKTVLGGFNDTEYINFHIAFDQLIYSEQVITASFDNFKIVASKGFEKKLVDCIKNLKETCLFYLEGEIILDESETKIESMNITAMNYINVNRMKKGDKFVYIS